MAVSAHELVGQVAATRVDGILEATEGARAVFAVVDLDPEITSSIATRVAALGRSRGRVQVAIHHSLAAPWLDPALISDDVATRFRNRKDESVVATVFSVPGEQMEGVMQSLVNVQRINQPWLFDTTKAIVWARCALPGYEREVQDVLARIVIGAVESDVVHSVRMLAEFLSAINGAMTGPDGLSLMHAVGRALPCLRLPRECLPEMQQETFAKAAATQFRRLRDEYAGHLYLRTRKGEHRPRHEMVQRIGELEAAGDLEPHAAEALRELVSDRTLTSNMWSGTQARVAALPWKEVSAFFVERVKKKDPGLGQATLDFLEAEYPRHLKESDREALEDLKRNTQSASPEHEELFARHREHLRKDPKLLKKWERLIFDRPIECEDVALGLVEMAGSLFPAEGVDDPVMLVRLKGAEQRSFWTEKNTGLCRYLRDRYRGLGRVLGGDVELDFGLCWAEDWEAHVDEPVTRASKSAEFEFEGYAVPRADLPAIRKGKRLVGYAHKAQVVWKPGAKSFALAFSEDMRRVLPADAERAYLLTATVDPAKSARGGAAERVTLDDASSVNDAQGGNRGLLTNPNVAGNRVHESVLAALDAMRNITPPEASGRVCAALDVFRDAYTDAVRAFVDHDGAGLADPAAIRQAGMYGELLDVLRRDATAGIAIKDVWEPIMRIGTATVAGDRPAMIVAPWHPLRLLELAAKARQCADAIARVMRSGERQASGVSDYVRDRRESLSKTFYADVALGRFGDDVHLLCETSARCGYGLLQLPFSLRGSLTDEPTEGAVDRFGRIAEEYLALSPHEKANFSAVLLDAESEDLPVLMANHLSRQIEDERELRCDLLVTHEDPVKLRDIYERQNRRIGHEIESSITSEAARAFMSRLRVGITSPKSLSPGGGAKPYDIVMLHDVIARKARVAWHEVDDLPDKEGDVLAHNPADVSRRRSIDPGSLTASVFLCSPDLPRVARAYVDTLHDVHEGRSRGDGRHHLPVQEVRVESSEIADKLAQAHACANWVITYDRIVDRRLIARGNGRIRILRHYSRPRSVHNVIVSSEFTSEALRDRLKADLEALMPESARQTLDDLLKAVQSRSASMSGGLVMRAMQFDNYARELIGIVVGQRETELLLDGGGEHRTATFFLDEFGDWLNLKSDPNLADLLSVDLSVRDGRPLMRLVVVESKCVGLQSASGERADSLKQLETTYAAMTNRFAEGNGTVDPHIWRGRLADMLVEHMEPWDELGGIPFDGWMSAIRDGGVNIDISGHSIVALHDTPEWLHDNPTIVDEGKSVSDRRRVAQWVVGQDRIRRCLSGIAEGRGEGFLREPDGWPAGAAPGPVAEEPRREPRPEADPDAADAPTEAATTAAPGDAAPAEGTPEPEGPSLAGGTEARATGGSRAAPEPPKDEDTPPGWLPAVYGAVLAMSHRDAGHDDEQWLEERVRDLRMALQGEGMDAPVRSSRLTPNSGLVYLDGKAVSVAWLERKSTELMTRHGLEILRITPMPGQIAVSIKRPRRSILHLADAWLRRRLPDTAPAQGASPVIGEREDDGELFYLPMAGPFADQERAAPHTIVSGSTGSGKGILTTSLVLDLCAFNDPANLRIYLIDPKRGIDYAWSRTLPHMEGDIVETKDDAVELLSGLVREMESRYERIREAGVSNIDQYRALDARPAPMPRIAVFFDEVASWMQDDDFKERAEPLLNEIAIKARASGIHLFMIYQRADNQVMTMQLRTNLGNKLILKLGDEGSSRIALNEKGAERLLGKGHVICKLDSDDKVYGQVPYIGPDEVGRLARAIGDGWRAAQERQDAAE